MDTESEVRIDKTAFSIVKLANADDEKTYWLAKTPHERLRAIELIRQTLYGYTSASSRLQRILEVVKQERG